MKCEELLSLLSSDGKMRLSQYGIQKAELRELASKFLQSNYINDPAIERQFLSFCAKLKNPSHILSIQPNWEPLPEVISHLTAFGVSKSFVEHCLKGFKNTIGRYNNVDLNSAFQNLTLSGWAKVSINPKAVGKTYMVKGWEPSKSIRENLHACGLNDDLIDLSVGEYVLYWSECGEPRFLWDTHFLRWVKQQHNIL